MSTPSSTSIWSEPERRIPLSKIVAGTIVGAVAAAAANAVVFLVADAAGAFPDDVLVESPGSDPAPIGLGNVIFASVTWLIVAGIVFAAIARFSRRPIQIYLYVAIVVLVWSLALPFTIDDAPGYMLAALLLMHFVAAAIGVGIMFRAARS